MKLLKLFLLVVLILGCQKKEDQKKPANVILVNKYVKIEKGGGAETMGSEFFNNKVWIEGTIKNIGDLPANDIKIVFNVPILLNPKLEDNISYLAPGESISFKTNSGQSQENREPYVQLENISFD